MMGTPDGRCGGAGGEDCELQSGAERGGEGEETGTTWDGMLRGGGLGWEELQVLDSEAGDREVLRGERGSAIKLWGKAG